MTGLFFCTSILEAVSERAALNHLALTNFLPTKQYFFRYISKCYDSLTTKRWFWEICVQMEPLWNTIILVNLTSDCLTLSWHSLILTCWFFSISIVISSAQEQDLTLWIDCFHSPFLLTYHLVSWIRYSIPEHTCWNRYSMLIRWWYIVMLLLKCSSLLLLWDCGLVRLFLHNVIVYLRSDWNRNTWKEKEDQLLIYKHR